MTTFNKQAFEDKLYEFVTDEVNVVFPELVKSGGDVLQYHRQLLQAIHFVIEETIVQNIHGLRVMAQVQRNKEGN